MPIQKHTWPEDHACGNLSTVATTTLGARVYIALVLPISQPLSKSEDGSKRNTESAGGCGMNNKVDM